MDQDKQEYTGVLRFRNQPLQCRVAKLKHVPGWIAWVETDTIAAHGKNSVITEDSHSMEGAVNRLKEKVVFHVASILEYESKLTRENGEVEIRHCMEKSLCSVASTLHAAQAGYRGACISYVREWLTLSPLEECGEGLPGYIAYMFQSPSDRSVLLSCPAVGVAVMAKNEERATQNLYKIITDNMRRDVEASMSPVQDDARPLDVELGEHRYSATFQMRNTHVVRADTKEEAEDKRNQLIEELVRDSARIVVVDAARIEYGGIMDNFFDVRFVFYDTEEEAWMCDVPHSTSMDVRAATRSHSKQKSLRLFEGIMRELAGKELEQLNELRTNGSKRTRTALGEAVCIVSLWSWDTLRWSSWCEKDYGPQHGVIHWHRLLAENGCLRLIRSNIVRKTYTPLAGTLTTNGSIVTQMYKHKSTEKVIFGAKDVSTGDEGYSELSMEDALDELKSSKSYGIQLAPSEACAACAAGSSGPSGGEPTKPCDPDACTN